MFRAKEYVKAESLKEAYELNQKKGSVIVGGMMWLKMSRGYRVTAIDLSDLYLNQIEENETEFRIGCMCTLRKVELHGGLNQYFGNVFTDSLRPIVGTQFRNGATIGGSVFGRFGFSDILTCLLMLDTFVELYQGGVIPLAEFVAMKYDRDLLIRIIIKKDDRKTAYYAQRNSKTDFPLIACGVAKKGETYWISVGARPKKARQIIIDNVARNSIPELTASAIGQLDFGTNMRGSGEYRKHLASVYVGRLMEQLEEEEA